MLIDALEVWMFIKLLFQSIKITTQNISEMCGFHFECRMFESKQNFCLISLKQKFSDIKINLTVGRNRKYDANFIIFVQNFSQICSIAYIVSVNLWESWTWNWVALK